MPTFTPSFCCSVISLYSVLSGATALGQQLLLKQHRLLHELLKVCGTTTSSPQAVLEQASETICTIFEVDRCLVAFYSADNHRLIWGAIAHAAHIPTAQHNGNYPAWDAIAPLIDHYTAAEVWVVDERFPFQQESESGVRSALSCWTQSETQPSLKWIGGFLTIEQWQNDPSPQESSRRVWQPEELHLIHIAIHHIEQAIHQALLNQQAEERVQRAALLQRLTVQIRESLDLNQIFSTVTTELGQLVVVDHCSIMRFVAEHRVWHSVIEYRSHPDVPSNQGITIPDENNPFSAQLRAFETVQVSDTRTIADPINRDFAKPYEGAWLIIPIHHDRTLWGAIIFNQVGCPRYWHESEVEFLKTVADQLAIAIHQATLYERIQQHNQRLAIEVAQRTEQLENALIAADAAEQAKNQFLAVISHELRTPLTPVIGMSSALLQQWFGSLNAKQLEYLKIVHDSGNRLLQLINGILDYVRLKTGAATLHITGFSLYQVAAQSLITAQTQAQDKEIALHANLDRLREAPAFWGDERRIGQILNDLLSNAVKFTPTGGQVWLRIDWKEEGVLIEVEDTGIGIPEEKQHLLFETFQQTETTLNRGYEGIGLGLARTRQLAEMHQGTVYYQTEVGRGSVFSVYLKSQQPGAIDD